MEKTVNISRKDAETFAAYFENENPHHLVGAAVLAGKRLKESLDSKESQIESGSKSILYAIKYKNNWDGEGDVYYMIAELKNGRFFDFENGTELLQYVGDEILKYWHLNVDSFVKSIPIEMIEKIMKDLLGNHYDSQQEAGEELQELVNLFNSK